MLMASVSIVFSMASSKENENPLDNFVPKDPKDPQVEMQAEEQLEEWDKEYEAATGKRSHLPVGKGTCYQMNCPVYAVVDKATQSMSLFVNGEQIGDWDVSTGVSGFGTPNFDKRPNGRIY